MTTSSSDSSGLPIKTSQEIEPLSVRTQRRLQNMERFTRRVGNTSIGFDARSLAMESRVRSASQLLVVLLEELE